jgi:hypothetical protein
METLAKTKVDETQCLYVGKGVVRQVVAHFGVSLELEFFNASVPQRSQSPRL